MKKRKPNATERQLMADWEAIKSASSKPLERGAVANGLKVKVAAKLAPAEPPSRDYEATFKAMVGSTAPPTVGRYTGEKCIGVALQHKSNYTPVFNTDAAVEIARMRR